MRLPDKLSACLALTKPTIILLVLITGAAGLVLEGSLSGDPLRFGLALVLLAMAGGSANAFNQYLEREVDAAMTRTSRRRPLPMGRIKPAHALLFAYFLGIVSTLAFAYYFNLLAAILSLSTILFYSLFYTLYLKPRTPLNIVIGGAAGAMAPVIAWAAASGGLTAIPWLMAAIIFFWTPPHFWSLALCLKSDYKKVKYPMLPLVAGDDFTWRRIVGYSVVTLLTSLTLSFLQAGLIYSVTAVSMGVALVWLGIRGSKAATVKQAWSLFGYSIIYLIVLFTSMMVDQAVNVRL